jgi:hypothetical protein
VGKPKFVEGLLTYFLWMGGIPNLGLQVVSKNLCGGLDLSLFVNFVVFLPIAPLCFHLLQVISHLHLPLLVPHGVCLVSSHLSLWLFLPNPYLFVLVQDYNITKKIVLHIYDN